MEVYTIYDNPQDFPNDFVIKKWDCSVMPPKQDLNYVFISRSLEQCRKEMYRRGLINIGRTEHEDPVILETWI